MGEEDKIREKLSQLKKEHQDLDNRISELTSNQVFDQLLVQRLKRKKLQLKDEISDLQSYLCDDIIA